MEPITNGEKYLAALTGESVVLPDPITRKEIFLAAAAGMAVSVPDPITREEMYLSQIKPGDGSGVVIRNQNKTITQNGTYKADSGYTGLGTVTVAVPEPVLESLVATENGKITPADGVDGFSDVTVNVPAPTLTTLTVTENGEYTPAVGVDGFSKVTVAVESSGGGGDDTAFISVLEGTATDLVLPDGLIDLKTILNKSASMRSVTFPDTLETIGEAVFAYLTTLNTPIVFPASLKSIEKNAFNSCYKVPSITFKGKPESIHAQAFNGALSNGVINCPWSEGEVANAPWGASSATINYNYTGG